jgi:hypothetical protein
MGVKSADGICTRVLAIVFEASIFRPVRGKLESPRAGHSDLFHNKLT